MSGCWIIKVRPEYQAGRGKFSRPNHAGYTDDIHQAGRFSELEAKGYELDCPDKYQASLGSIVPVCDHIDTIEQLQADKAELVDVLGILTAMVTQEKGNVDKLYLEILRDSEKVLAKYKGSTSGGNEDGK